MVAPAAEVEDERFGHVFNEGESAAHVAVHGAVADGHFGFVAGGQHECAKLIGERHDQVTAC